MDPAAILALLSELYSNVVRLSAEVTSLREELAAARSEAEPTPPDG